MRVAIHQPNFFPWLGLFQKIFLSEKFIFFDHVQAMGGRSWLSRNKILVNGKNVWLTMPVRKAGRFGQRINEVEISYETNFLSKHLQTIELNYKKTKFFNEFFPKLVDIYESKPRYICDFNSRFIIEVCNFLELNCSFVSSNALLKANPYLDNLSGNCLILEICRLVEADEYVSGTGCLDFIEPVSFKEKGIKFSFQEFVHPTYLQQKTIEFTSKLSILDALFCVGRDETSQMVSQQSLIFP